MANTQEQINELEKRVAKLEHQVFGTRQKAVRTSLAGEGPLLQLHDLNIPTQVLSELQTRIRKVSYWDLVLVLLYFAPHSLTYSHIMSISKELKKPVSYDWLNTEFHRKKYSGLVRSEPTPGSQEKVYTLNEPGRRKAETVLNRLKAENQ